MKLPPDVEFYGDIRLFVHRPRGVLNEATISEVVFSATIFRSQIARAV